MSICFKCAERPGIKRRSHAMRRDWYETREDPARTIYLCCECYVPDPLAGKRTETAAEVHEAVWGETEYQDYQSVYDWDRVVRIIEDFPAISEGR